jgi:hypothetical protein
MKLMLKIRYKNVSYDKYRDNLVFKGIQFEWNIWYDGLSRL